MALETTPQIFLQDNLEVEELVGLAYSNSQAMANHRQLA